MAPESTLSVPTGKYVQLAQALQAARHRIGLSLEEVSRQTGIPRSQLSDAEAGALMPTAEQLDTLGRTYQLTSKERSDLLDHRLRAEIGIN
ncbi:hypothetical protein GCM10023259_093190 [Thermocatellispora tengchongensis]